MEDEELQKQEESLKQIGILEDLVKDTSFLFNDTKVVGVIKKTEEGGRDQIKEEEEQRKEGGMDFNQFTSPLQLWMGIESNNDEDQLEHFRNQLNMSKQYCQNILDRIKQDVTDNEVTLDIWNVVCGKTIPNVKLEYHKWLLEEEESKHLQQQQKAANLRRNQITENIAANNSTSTIASENKSNKQQQQQQQESCILS